MRREKIVIPERVEHEGIYKLWLEVDWVCLICGEPRGEPFFTRSYDGSRTLVVSGWVNPCGHIEKYSLVRAAYNKKETINGQDDAGRV